MGFFAQLYFLFFMVLDKNFYGACKWDFLPSYIFYFSWCLIKIFKVKTTEQTSGRMETSATNTRRVLPTAANRTLTLPPTRTQINTLLTEGQSSLGQEVNRTSSLRDREEPRTTLLLTPSLNLLLIMVLGLKDKGRPVERLARREPMVTKRIPL